MKREMSGSKSHEGQPAGREAPCRASSGAGTLSGTSRFVSGEAHRKGYGRGSEMGPGSIFGTEDEKHVLISRDGRGVRRKHQWCILIVAAAAAQKAPMTARL